MRGLGPVGQQGHSDPLDLTAQAVPEGDARGKSQEFSGPTGIRPGTAHLAGRWWTRLAADRIHSSLGRHLTSFLRTVPARTTWMVLMSAPCRMGFGTQA